LSTEARIRRPRRRLTPEQRREKIVAAATTLFGELGYRGTSIERIARESGVTPPVIYDHFESKQALYRDLLELHYARLREIWGEGLGKDDPPEARVAASVRAWFSYMQDHRAASRLLFRTPTDDAEVAAIHAEVTAASRAAIEPLMAGGDATALPRAQLDLIWELLRGTLQGLALWWNDHPEVGLDQVVVVAMTFVWPGFERLQAGALWSPGAA
jgi:AcrR family transcriptional regulator